jgi:UDP-N-acetylmuramoylalanine--D-glutamate ligase
MPRMSTRLHGKRVTVMGLGRFGGGLGVTRWLLGQGAHVLITDRESPEKLGESVAALHALPVDLRERLAFRLGEHREDDFRNCDVVVVNPAVPPASPYLQVAEAAGVPVTTEINLFLERNPARCIGVTGTVGKSTTVAMIGHILTRCLPQRRVWVGGNIGRSLLDELPNISADDWVVLELSSFQLLRTAAIRWSPSIAVITNVAPNHLDWHPNFAHYLASKLNIIRYQDPERGVIVVGDDPMLLRQFDLMHGDLAGVWRASARGEALEAVLQSTSAIDTVDRRLRWPNVSLATPGAHNRQNAAMALTVAHLAGVAEHDAAAPLSDFAGLEHRLERVGVVDGVAYVNDSKSTTPEAALTAIAAFDGPVLLLLGGYDKHADLRPLAQTAAMRAKYAACIGQTGPAICDAVRSSGGQADTYDDFDAAVEACRQRASAGDTVLLSPGCASWGMFTDYRERGARFARLVRKWMDKA